MTLELVLVLVFVDVGFLELVRELVGPRLLTEPIEDNTWEEEGFILGRSTIATVTNTNTDHHLVAHFFVYEAQGSVSVGVIGSLKQEMKDGRDVRTDNSKRTSSRSTTKRR